MLEELFPSYDQCGRQAVQMKYLSLPFSSKITDSKHWKSSRITSTFTREHLNSGTRNPAASNPFKRWGVFWCVFVVVVVVFKLRRFYCRFSGILDIDESVSINTEPACFCFQFNFRFP